MSEENKNITISGENSSCNSPRSMPVCNAPFANMFFDINGMVHACCLSWKCSENIREKSIKEIWNGEKFKLIREKIKQNDLDFACKICNSYLKSGNSDLALINMFSRFKRPGFEYPVMMEFEMQNTCNLECIMCNRNLSSSIRKNRDKLPPLQTAYPLDFIKQLEEFIPHLEVARFIGGEPFLIETYFEIWEKIIEINPAAIISISTNGTVLNDRIKRLLGKGRFEIVFSIDSLEKVSYERIRKNAEFEVVFRNLEFFHDYCREKNTFFNIVTCPMQQNWEQLPVLTRYCNDNDIPIFFNTVIEPFDCALWPLEPEKLKKIISLLARQEFIYSGNDLKSENIARYNNLIGQLNYWSEKSQARAKKTSDQLQITANNTESEFIEKLKTYLETTIWIDKNNEDINFIQLLEKINSVSEKLPGYFSKEYLFSVLNTMEISQVAESLITSSIEGLVSDARTMITNHFYEKEM